MKLYFNLLKIGHFPTKAIQYFKKISQNNNLVVSSPILLSLYFFKTSPDCI